MVTATLARGGTSVTLDLIDSSGSPVAAADVGKPNLNIQESGSMNPRFVDFWSGQEMYTLFGRFTGSNAYADAITLADLIKSNGNGNPITLNIGMGEFDTDMKVVPAAGQEQSLSLAYNPGWSNYVEVDVALTRVSESVGYDQPATTPTASGSGPIQITDGSDTVDIDTGVTVSRAVGRPNSTVRRKPASHPFHVDAHKTAFDGFELEFRSGQDTVDVVTRLANVFSGRLQRSALTLDFNGLFGMGAFSVVPEGSGALRHTRQAGEGGTSLVPTISLRRVFAD